MVNILILEDDYTLAKSWQSALVAEGHTVTLSFTSSEALLHTQNDGFDIYIVDLKIDIDLSSFVDSGVRFLGQLHKLHNKDEIHRRVIGVSGLLIDTDDRQSRHAFQMFDVRAFLPKPFSTEDLVNAVNERIQLLEDRDAPASPQRSSDQEGPE